MGRVLKFSDVGGVHEVAEDLGVATRNVHAWMERRESTGFPLPVMKFKMGHLFNLEETRQWYKMWTATRRRRT